MQDQRRQNLVYQLRKCLAQLMKAHSAAIACGDVETARYLKAAMSQIKRQMKLTPEKNK